jgi:hypothetical protein
MSHDVQKKDQAAAAAQASGNRLSVWLIVFAAVCLAALAIWYLRRPTPEPQVVGFVIASEGGDWFKNGDKSQTLEYNTPLVAGDEVAPLAANQDAVLHVCLFDGKPHTIAHNKDQPHEKHQLTAVEPSGLFKKLGRAFGSRYRPVAAETLSRGGSGVLADAPAKLDANGLDLGQVFAPKFAGKYSLEFVRIDCDEKPLPGAPIVAEFNWDSDHPQPLSGIVIEPGLYRMDMVETGEQGEKLPASVIVLVAQGADYDAVNAYFQEAVALTEGWDERIDLEQKLGFLRACLLALAEPTEVKK